jgi:hypothetical protein
MNLMKRVFLPLVFSFLLLAGCNGGKELYREPAPLIELDVPDGRYCIKTGDTLTIAPQVRYDRDAVYAWSLNGIIVSTSKIYLFTSSEPGIFLLTFQVSRQDVTVSRDIRIEVQKRARPYIYMAVPANGYTIAPDSALILRPVIANGQNGKYLWTVNSVEVSHDSIYTFSAAIIGTYQLHFSVTTEDGNDRTNFNIHVLEPSSAGDDPWHEEDPVPPSGKFFRPVQDNSNPDWDVIFEYTPAPGQFINERETGGFSDEDTPEKAILYAETRLKQGFFVSLGAFGGYIVAGFDHSIANDGGYNLKISGNAGENSSEPGIVWVMQDGNGNGLPDDTWYELRGSEHGKEKTLRQYHITYFRPREPGSPVHWIDNLGITGKIDYLGSFHGQDSYYPGWIATDYYTLRGTRLESRNYLSETGTWICPPYDWGYVDNNDQVLFRISDAVTSKGNPIHLEFIDFIKIQTAVNGKSGWLGEISTEVTRIADYNMIK